MPNQTPQTDSDGFTLVVNRRKDKRQQRNQNNRKRASNRGLVSTLMERYRNMIHKRWGTDIDEKLDMNELLLDCMKHDMNIVLGAQFEYTHLNELNANTE